MLANASSLLLALAMYRHPRRVSLSTGHEVRCGLENLFSMDFTKLDQWKTETYQASMAQRDFLQKPSKLVIYDEKKSFLAVLLQFQLFLVLAREK